MKRSGKFYRQNEAQVMRELGLKPTKNSGAGWVEKEDGESDKLICQLKSTDKASITLKRDDLQKLREHALQSHKVPVFAVQFLQSHDVLLCVAPEDVAALADALDPAKFRVDNDVIADWVRISEDWDKLPIADAGDDWEPPNAVKTDGSSRAKFAAEIELKNKKEEKSAK